jgi:hypothetical protein
MTALPHYDAYNSYGNPLKRTQRAGSPLNWGLIIALSLNLAAWSAILWLASQI